MFKLLDYNDFQNVKSIIKQAKEFEVEDNEDFFNVSFYSIFDEDKNKIGFFGLECREEKLCFCYFYIFEQYRNKGYAKKTLEEMLEKFKNEYKYIYGIVNENNFRAIKIYQNYLFLGKDCISLIKVNDFKLQKDCLYHFDNKYEACFSFNSKL